MPSLVTAHVFPPSTITPSSYHRQPVEDTRRSFEKNQDGAGAHTRCWTRHLGSPQTASACPAGPGSPPGGHPVVSILPAQLCPYPLKEGVAQPLYYLLAECRYHCVRLLCFVCQHFGASLINACSKYFFSIIFWHTEASSTLSESVWGSIVSVKGFISIHWKGSLL